MIRSVRRIELPAAARRCGALACGALWLAPVAHGETLAGFLKSGKLEDIENPVPINYFLEQAPASLDPALREQAQAQVLDALRHQTSALNKIGESLSGAMSGPTMQQMNKQSQQQATTSNLLKQTVLSHFGVQDQQPRPTQKQMEELQQEMRSGMVDPWVRGLESARALERVGNAQAAGRFYMNCIQSAPPDFLADTCLNGILGMGTQRAQALLVWIVEHAEDAALGGISASGPKGQTSVNVVWLRGAALRGLGVLVGSGSLPADQSAADFEALMRYAQGKDHEPYFADAAEGLGRAGDARAKGPLQELAHAKDPKVAQAALRALAVGMHEPGATAQVRRYLDDRDPNVQLRAVDTLLDAGDEAGYTWARELIVSSRDADSGTTDLRPRVVRDLVARGDARSRAALENVLQQGGGNDFLRAWVAIGLLQLGDRNQLESTLTAIGRHDWTLDRPGVKELWQKIRPFLQLAAQAALGAPVTAQQAARVILNFALAERAKAIERASDREVASLQIRLQACDALATVDDPRASEQLTALLADPEPAVRLSAAQALVLQPNKAALDGIVKAYHADFGAAEGTSRTPEVRAALLRAALTRAPTDERTRALVREAARAEEPGIQFMGLVAGGP